MITLINNILDKQDDPSNKFINPIESFFQKPDIFKYFEFIFSDKNEFFEKCVAFLRLSKKSNTTRDDLIQLYFEQGINTNDIVIDNNIIDNKYEKYDYYMIYLTNLIFSKFAILINKPYFNKYNNIIRYNDTHNINNKKIMYNYAQDFYNNTNKYMFLDDI